MVCLYHAGSCDVMCRIYVRVRVCLGLELGYGIFVSSLRLVSFRWCRLDCCGRVVGRWCVGLVVFGLGTRMVENEITSKSAYVQH